MDKHKLAAVYAQLALGYQNALVMKVLEKYKSLEAFSRAVYQKQVDPALLRPKQMEKAMQAKLEDARKIVDDCARLGIMVAAIGDEHYPKPFLQLCDPPAVVYIKGTLPDFDTTLGITVVGSRKVEQRACDNAFWLGKSLARAGACVISGLAQGIDASAQGGALDAEGKPWRCWATA